MYYFIAEPIYNCSGNLYAVEILTRFPKSGQTENMDLFFSKMTTEDKLSLFIEQVDEVNKIASFFMEHNLLCSINIDYASLNKLCQYRDLARAIFSISHLRIELNENTTPLEIRHAYNLITVLRSSCARELFWLDDFTQEKFSPEAYLTWGSMINLIKIDRSLLLDKKYLELQHIVAMIKYCNCRIAVEGVETTESLKGAILANADYIQGYLFPHKKIREISQIPLTFSL